MWLRPNALIIGWKLQHGRAVSPVECPLRLHRQATSGYLPKYCLAADLVVALGFESLLTLRPPNLISCLDRSHLVTRTSPLAFDVCPGGALPYTRVNGFRRYYNAAKAPWFPPGVSMDL